MKQIVWGMVFVLLDWNIPLGERTIGLLPDWLGYWWLAKGFLAREEEWDGFRKGRVPALCLAVYGLVCYGMHIMKLTVRQEFILWVMELAAAVAAAVMAKVVVRGICHLEKTRHRELQGRKLGNLWLYMTVILILDGLLKWVPLVGMGSAVAAFAMALCWLAVLWDAGKRYDRE